jgi:hypothetical protein
MTVTIIPFMPNGWDPVAGFPAMAGNSPFLMKDIVLLAASVYLLRDDVMRALEPNPARALYSQQVGSSFADAGIGHCCLSRLLIRRQHLCESFVLHDSFSCGMCLSHSATLVCDDEHDYKIYIDASRPRL